MNKAKKIAWGLVFPFAIVADVVAFLCSIVSAFDGCGGDIGSAGFTDSVYARMSEKPLPAPEKKVPEYVAKEPVKAGKTGFDWMRLIVWGGLAVLLGFGVFVLSQSKGL